MYHHVTTQVYHCTLKYISKIWAIQPNISTTKTHLAYGIEKTINESQYDERAKDLLADKQVLARIAQHRIEEGILYLDIF